MSLEGRSRNLTVLFCIAAVAIVAFFAVSMFKGTALVRDSVTEDVTIIGKANGNCVIDTVDPVMSSKTVSNCDLEVGTKVTAKYKKGLSTAELASP